MTVVCTRITRPDQSDQNIFFDCNCKYNTLRRLSTDIAQPRTHAMQRTANAGARSSSSYGQKQGRQKAANDRLADEDAPSGDSSLVSNLKQFPNAFRIGGLKHVSDNLLGNTLRATSCWSGLLPKLRCLEVLLKNPMYRERFQHVCIGKSRPEVQQQFDKWSVSLKGLRWKSVVNFCLELERIEGSLRTFWDKSAFGNEDQLPKPPDPHTPDQ